MHRRTLPLLLPALLPAPRPARAQGTATTTVFAAASLAEGLNALAATWAAQGHPAPRLVLAASSALARQIEQGAPADIFASADEAWMDHLQQRGLIATATRRTPLGNTLVLVAPATAPDPATPVAPDAIAARLGPRGRLAVADPAHVPAGRYARDALQALGQWDTLEPRLARAENVRAALLLVERGEAPLGIVYATDAAVSTRVRVVGTFPPGSHAPIVYPFALTRRAADDAAAARLLDFLTGAEAAPVWTRLGFRAAQ
jgi:molybdate transport system substrate-binding protein